MSDRFARKRGGPGSSSGPPLRPFHGIALTLLVPALALLAYFGYRFFSEATRPLERPPTTSKEAQPKSGEKRPSAAKRKEKKIVLILDDVGYDPALVESVANLDPSINFAVLPNAPYSTTVAQRLSSRGFEVLCHLPMEPVDYPRVSPGARAILTSMSDDEIRETTRASLRRVPNSRGVNNHMGSRATEDSRVMRQMFSVLREEGQYFIDSRTTAGSVGESLARAMKIQTNSRDVFLDPDQNEAAIRRQVRSLAEFAERSGIGVGIGHLYPETIKVLHEEVPKLKKRGFRFVRASEAVN